MTWVIVGLVVYGFVVTLVAIHFALVAADYRRLAITYGNQIVKAQTGIRKLKEIANRR